MSHVRFAVLAAALALVPAAAAAQSVPRPHTEPPPAPDPQLCPTLVNAYAKTGFADWLDALDGCWKTGDTNWVDIFWCGFDKLPVTHKYMCVKEALWQAPITHTTITDIIEFNSDAECPALIDKYQQKGGTTWTNALLGCKLPNGVGTTYDEIFACAFGSLPRDDQRPCLREYFQKLPITGQLIVDVRTVNLRQGTVSANQLDIDFSGVGPEVCELPAGDRISDDYYAPKAPESIFDRDGKNLTIERDTGRNLGDNEGRLRADLRQVARTADPRGCALPMAARSFALADATTDPTVRQELLTSALAYADLAVTGRRAFEAFAHEPPGAAYCIDIASQPPDAMTPGCAPPPMSFIPPSKVVAGCGKALDRAYDVANYLRTGQVTTVAGPWYDANGMRTPAAIKEHDRKAKARDALGWIAVSGEDDLPHRPVNVPSSDSPQFNIDVTVNVPFVFFGLEVPFPPMPITVNARYIIAQAQGNELERRAPAMWTLEPDFKPSIPEGSEVLLFIHGMDSRAEEADDTGRFLFARMAQLESRKNVVVVAVDLPSSGYTQALLWSAISPMAAIGEPNSTNTDFRATGNTPLLDFLEDFVVAFAETLDREPGIDGRLLPSVKTVMGGSLGGNLSLRLGRRANTPWIKNVVAWSPASVWLPLSAGPKPLSHHAVKLAWHKASLRDASDPLDLSSSRLFLRGDFFVDTWDRPISTLAAMLWTQPETWYSPTYPCWQAAINNARVDRHETYTPAFLYWRWRLAAEQLIYSHHSIDVRSGKPLFLLNDKRTLLACGGDDAYVGAEICPNTRITANNMTLTPGQALYLKDTGHALHSERPRYWALQIQTFLGL